MHAAAPMWRNGRRNGLKIRSREKRGMGSTPIIGTSEKRVLRGKIGHQTRSNECAAWRIKTTKLQSTWQVFAKSVHRVAGRSPSDCIWLIANDCKAPTLRSAARL